MSALTKAMALALIGIGASTVLAQTSRAELLPLDEDAARTWRNLSAMRITPDGNFFVYASGLTSNYEEQAELVIRALKDTREWHFPLSRGIGAADSLALSRSGRWVGFLQDFGGRTGVSVVEVSSSRRIDYPDARAFEFAGVDDNRLLLQTGSDLEVLDPLDASGKRLRLNGVVAHSLSPNGRRLAWVDASGLNVMDLVDGWRRTLAAVDGARAFSWSPDSNSLVVANVTSTPARLVAFTHIGKTGAQKKEFSVASASPPFTWRVDGQGFFFSVARPAQREPEPPLPAPIIWNTDSRYLPKEPRRDRADLHFASVRTGKVIPLEDEQVRLTDGERFTRILLARDLARYGSVNVEKEAGRMASPHVADYFLIDSDSGKRTLLVRALPVMSRLRVTVEPRLSPDGSVLLYQNVSGHYIARDVRSGGERNLTAGLAPSFRMAGNDPPSGWQPLKNSTDGASQMWNGWTADGAHALIADPYDIWALPIRGGKPINLTGGVQRQGSESYEVASLSSGFRLGTASAPRAPALDREIYFYRYDPDTGIEAFVRREPRSAALVELYSEYADIRYYRADHTAAYVMAHTSSVDSWNVFGVDDSLRRAAALTDVNPQQRRYAWPPQTRMLVYENARGERRRAIVHLPVDYREGQRYPGLFNIYESWDAPHEYHYIGRGDPTEIFKRHGYVYVLPDVHPRIGDAGESALDDTESAVRAAVKAGFIDERAVGLMGHSFGGYEALYLATRSQAFKAIVAYAGITNTMSHCGQTGYGGISKATICEFDQPYTGTSWWQAPDVFQKNNPLMHVGNVSTPLLLANGDHDDAVNFSQAMEMFLALRRLSKPAALLQYRGEGHDFGPVAARDFNARMLEFYDHFLKGAPAPAWWQPDSR